MVTEIRQASGDLDCDYCHGGMKQGTLYLYTRGMYRAYYRCRACAIKYGYVIKDLQTFRPDLVSMRPK